MKVSGGPSLLYYQFKGKLMTVIPAKNYKEALDFAQEAFPELRHTARDLLSFSIGIRMKSDGDVTCAGISPSAWAQTIATAKERAIIFIEVETAVEVPNKDSEAPPKYTDHELERPHQPTPSSHNLESNPKHEEKWKFWRRKA